MSNRPSLAWRRVAARVLASLAIAAASPACLLATEGQGGPSPAGASDGGVDAGAGDAAAAHDAGGKEDCENGLDDDGDGLVDCADSDCEPDHECIETAPEYWDGPLRVRVVAPGEPAEACVDGQAPTSNGMGALGKASCEPCQCGALAGAVCDPPHLVCGLGTYSCQGGVDVTKEAIANSTACDSIGDALGTWCETTGSLKLSAGGKCTPSGGAPNGGPATAARVDSCRPKTWPGGCPAGHACVRKASPAYAALGACVMLNANAPTCPASFPDQRTVVWQTVVDNRACAACGCAPPAVACTPGAYTLHYCAACGACPTTTFANDWCSDSGASPAAEVSVEITWPVASGSCAQNGGDPSGEVYAEGELTYCCRK